MTTLKVLGQVAPGAGTVTALYTCGAAGGTVVSTIVACNTSATPTTISLSIAVAGAADAAAQYFVKLMPIGANETITFTLGITPANTDVIRCLATLATVNFHAFGQEN